MQSKTIHGFVMHSSGRKFLCKVNPWNQQTLIPTTNDVSTYEECIKQKVHRPHPLPEIHCLAINKPLSKLKIIQAGWLWSTFTLSCKEAWPLNKLQSLSPKNSTCMCKVCLNFGFGEEYFLNIVNVFSLFRYCFFWGKPPRPFIP